MRSSQDSNLGLMNARALAAEDRSVDAVSIGATGALAAEDRSVRCS